MSKSYRIGFGWVGKFVVVTTLGATLAGGIAMADAKSNVEYPVATEEVVQLDPVTVTISSARFDAIRAEAQATAAVAQR